MSASRVTAARICRGCPSEATSRTTVCSWSTRRNRTTKPAARPRRGEDATSAATLRRRPRLEISDEGRAQRQLSEGASLGRRPGGPPGHAERAPRSGRRFPHGDAAVTAEVARDEAGDEPRDVRRPQTLLGLAMATRKRQIDLGPREPLEDGDGGAIRPVGGDLRLLGLQHAQHRRVAGPEAEAVIEVEGPRAERLRALVAELGAVHNDRSHAEEPPGCPEELGREGRP